MIGFILFFCYPLFLLSVGIYISITKEMNSERYFFADKNIHWFILGISVLTTSFFSPYVFGLTLSGYNSKLPLSYGLISVIMIFLLGWLLAPIYSKMRIYTLPEYFEKRYNRACRFFVSTLYILTNIFVRLFLTLIICNILIRTFTDLDTYFSLLFFLLITGTYLIIGGLKAEIYVSIAQILFIAVVTLGFTYWFFIQKQGINPGTYNTSTLPLFNSSISPKISTVELIIGLPIIGFWFLCADQIVIQKILSVRNLNSIRKASIVSIIFQIIPILIFILPGLITTNLFPNNTSEEIFRKLFNEGFLPKSLRIGLILSIVLAMTASFANFFNSTANLITFDFYKTLKSDASDRELVLVGRITIILLLFISILLIPITQPFDWIFYLKLFYSFVYFVALIAAILICGLIFKSIKASNAFSVLCICTAIILFKLIHELYFNNSSSVGLFYWFVHSAFLEFSIFIFLFSSFLLIVFSRINWVKIKVAVLIPKGVLAKLFSKDNIHKKVFLALPVFLAAIGLAEILHI